jgi:hypothetical protein
VSRRGSLRLESATATAIQHQWSAEWRIVLVNAHDVNALWLDQR